MSPEAVSIIVPTFNRAAYLKECIGSLVDQTVPAQQIVVMDDGSEDDTPTVARSFGDRVTYLRKPNGGKPSAVNLALTQCTGSLIWLFDDDDVALPGAIEARLAVLASNPDCGFVYSAHKLGSDGPGGHIQHGALCLPVHPPAEAFLLTLLRSCFFHLNSALVRRELYLRAGPFDPALKAGEDYDMQVRLARLGAAAFCPEPSFVFRQHAGVRGDKAQQYNAAERSRVFRRYSAALGRKVRTTVPMGEYLAPTAPEPPDAAAHRQALVNRAQVMANFGCMPEMFDDLQVLVGLTSEMPAIPTQEAQALQAAMRTGWACDAAEDDWPAFLELARHLADTPGGRRVVRALAIGLWHVAKGYPGTWPERARRAQRALQLALVGGNIP